MGIEQKHLDKLSRDLMKAKAGEPLTIIPTEKFPELSISEAYAVQFKTMATRVNRGEVVVGWKAAATNKAVQEKFGIHEPLYGHIFNSMVIPEGDAIPISRFVHPIVEGEICFLLKKDLKGPGVTIAKVLMATAGIVPAIEITNVRFKDIMQKAQGYISDNSNAGMVVLGGKLTPIFDIDLRLIGMVFEKNGEVIDSGAGAAVLGNPAEPVAKLANMLSEFGLHLSAGQFIITGSVTMGVPPEAGACFHVSFDRLGTVTTRFVE